MNVKKVRKCEDVYDLNCADAVLMFDHHYAEKAATPWYFQVTTGGPET